MPRGFDRALYVLPFDHRGSFQAKLFGWEPPLSDAQTAEIASAKQIIYDGFRSALWRAKKPTREQAVAEIARRYREFVDLFEEADTGPSRAPSDRARSDAGMGSPVA
jgi:hypothetical protein